jgi:hypothetical protein
MPRFYLDWLPSYILSWPELWPFIDPHELHFWLGVHHAN